MKGRRLLIANGQQVVPPEDYPLVAKGPKGYEPCIHRVSYIRTPWRDRDMGLVEHLLDPQRTLNDARTRRSSGRTSPCFPSSLAPGTASRTRTVPPRAGPDRLVRRLPEARVACGPPIPDSLFTMKSTRSTTWRRSPPSAPPRGVESGKGMATFIEQEQRRSQMQIQGLADFHSRLGRHLLLWVQQRYTEERLLTIQGRGHGRLHRRLQGRRPPRPDLGACPAGFASSR
jgi:hypothetical protein